MTNLRQKQRYLLTILAIGLCLFGAACGKKASVTTTTNKNTNEPMNINAHGQQTTPDSVLILSPEANAQLVSPFTVAGESTATTVYVSLVNATGTTLFSEPVAVHEGDFSITLNFNLTSTITGTVEVYEKDTNGTNIHLTKVPVIFTTGAPSQKNDNTNQSNTNSSQLQ